MSADNDSPDSDEVEKKGYSFVFRFIVFVFIAGPASVFALGIYGRIGVREAIAATERGNYSPMIILLMWFVGLLGTAVMIFKK